MFRRQHGIILLLVLALIVRILLLWYAIGLREHPDILRWKDWGRIAFLYGFADTYLPEHLTFGTYPNNMPPGTLYIVSFIYWLWLQFGKILVQFGIAPGSNPWINGPFLTLLYRIPSFFSDIGIAFILYAIANRTMKNIQAGLIAAAVFLFHPGVLFNSTFMGQWDAVNNFLFLFGVWAFFRGRHFRAAAWVACSLLTKLSLVFIIPILLYALYVVTRSIRTVIWAAVVAFAITMVGTLPVSWNPFWWYADFIFHHATGEMANITASALNGWWAFFRPHIMFESLDSTFSASVIHVWGTPFSGEAWFGLSLGVWAVVVFLTMCAPLGLSMIRLKKRFFEPKIFVLSMGMFCLLAYMWLPKMHVRYMYPSFAFFAMSIAFGAPIVSKFVVISLLDIINLFIVWHPMPLSLQYYTLLPDRNFQWSISILLVIFSFLLYRRVIRYILCA